jgi:ADP-ribose pyrophosphatase YjhB (NUDIX family)
MVEVALVGRSHPGIWALPKGTPRSGETIEQVAVREVQEETGLQVRLIAYIGNISYSFVRDQVRYQKQVRHFLFEAIGGDTALHDHEYDVVEWFSFAEASRRLTYQNEEYPLSGGRSIATLVTGSAQGQGRTPIDLCKASGITRSSGGYSSLIVESTRSPASKDYAYWRHGCCFFRSPCRLLR